MVQKAFPLIRTTRTIRTLVHRYERYEYESIIIPQSAILIPQSSFRNPQSAMPYTLEPYKFPSTRYTCPSCGAKRQFARYINIETGEYLADNVGRCNREQNCSYHYTPKQYFLDHPEQSSTKSQPLYTNPTLSHCQINKLSHSFSNSQILKSSHPQIPTLSHSHISTLSHSLIPDSLFQKSLSNYKHNHFITFLKSIFDPTTVPHLINTYLLGTSKHWPGSTVFWQIDTHGSIRTGKVMLYDPAKGLRVKQPYSHITWAHSVLKLSDYNLRQCFFGEHLLRLHPTLPVSIVESEKTALIASVYFPQFIWLATGGKHGCKWTTPQVFNILKGRRITLWPDIQACDDWKLKANELSKSGLHISVSTLLEQLATPSERNSGLDLADYLIRFKPGQFTEFPKETSTIHSKVVIAKAMPEAISSLYHQFLLEQHPLSFLQREGAGGEFWPLDALQSFFSSTQLPHPPIRLNPSTIIHNLPKFISSHLSVLHTYNGNKVFLPYLQRLQMLQLIINENRINTLIA